MNNNVINIAYCTDPNYLEYVGVSITSIILNNPHNKIHFHVFLYDVPNEDQEKLQKISPSIRIYVVSEEDISKYSDSQNNKIKHINRSMYIRLSIPRLLHNIVDKFIYLDADMLCFSDISSILSINIDSVICAVTQDAITSRYIKKNKERLSLSADFYFNSGFLYVNINNWLQFDTENKVNKILLSEQQKQLIYPDQDALNIILQKQVLFVDTNWNYLFTWMDDKQKEAFFYDKENLPYFIHFTGARKIWYKEHVGLAQNIYCFYKHFSPWAMAPLESYKNKMRINDYRIYAKTLLKKGQILNSIPYGITYLIKKLKKIN